MYPVPNQVNPDLLKERQNRTFDDVELTNWWYGGREKVERKQRIESFFLENPELESFTPLHYLSPKEQYEETIRRVYITGKRLQEWRKQSKEPLELSDGILLGEVRTGVVPSGNPIGLHLGMFLPAILGQGTEAQKRDWAAKAQNLEIIGTYAQTELGHGTFVRGLETTATYDPETKGFVINSPSLSSYKWWPGGMGHTTTHVILIAQLYTQGKARGVYPFIVQVRDEDTHMPMKGVSLGELGPKLGFGTANQGFAGFDNVWIPLGNMMMKNAQVLEDGSFVKMAPDVLTYATMTMVRVSLVKGCSDFLAMGTTIAVRYSAVRKQSQINPDEPEVAIMDHLTQQYKLYPQLAKSVVFRLAAQYILDMEKQVTEDLEQGHLGRLPEMHSLSCALKAVTTTETAVGLDILRMACGGHGYLTSSGLQNIYGFAAAARSYEGENTVLLLQTARFLMKTWQGALEGNDLQPTVAYFREVLRDFSDVPEFNADIRGILIAFQYSTGKLIQSAYENVAKGIELGRTRAEATNAASISLARAAEMHCQVFLLECGVTFVEKQTKKFSPELRIVLDRVVELFVLDFAVNHLDLLVPYVRISQDQIGAMKGRMGDFLNSIRPNAVAFVDSFRFHDKVLDSTLGAWDGNVYERLFEDAQKSPLNQDPVNKSFEEYLRPMMSGAKL